MCVCDAFVLAHAVFRGPLGECAGLIRMVLGIFLFFFGYISELCVFMCLLCVYGGCIVIC